ncbi:Uncharacterised protein [Pseudomonas putida]|nr:Uncharacterised protein [Pseudomonas putida]
MLTSFDTFTSRFYTYKLDIFFINKVSKHTNSI